MPKKEKKTYKIIKHSYRGWTREEQGTIEELIECFGCTLSYWHKPMPKTIKGLVSALNHCSDLRYAACYHRDYYEQGE